MPEPLEAAFTAEDWRDATWRPNCGPGAVAGIMGWTLEQVRPHMGDFEEKGYTNPALMWRVLDSLGVSWRKLSPVTWPDYGLVRVEWLGPWSERHGRAQRWHRHSHWVGSCRPHPANIGVFDINAIQSGGWMSLKDWGDTLVPWLLERCEPRATGKWVVTHAVEIDPASIPPTGARLL